MLKVFGVIVLIFLIVAGLFYFIYARPFLKKMEVTTIEHYDKDLTIVYGGGGNSGILVSDSVVLVIDTKMKKGADDLYKTVTGLAGKKPILVVNTHYHPDHTGGNSLYKGQTILAGGNYTNEMWIKNADAESMPTKWVKDRMDVKIGGDTATIFNLGRNIHTESDVVVYLHKRKMLFSGDVILNKQVPVLMGNADPEGYLKAFDLLPKQFDIQKVVPGHGKIGGTKLIDDFRQYFKAMKLAAYNGSKKDSIVEAYKDWSQIPFIMSPGATISFIKDKSE